MVAFSSKIENDGNFHRLESVPDEKARERLGQPLNNIYNPPRAYFTILNIAGYHLHASTEDDATYSGPSIGLERSGKVIGDIACSAQITRRQGEAHEVVITKLRGNRFNVCYYTGELDVLLRPQIVVLSLGDHRW